MGLFSFLFGGNKPAAAARPHAPPEAPPLHMPPEPVGPDPAAIAIDAAPEPPRTRGFELTRLRHAYAAANRAGDAAAAYEAACRLARFYKSIGAGRLSAAYRTAAEAQFGARLRQLSRDRRRPALAAVQKRASRAAGPARTRLAATAQKLGGPDAARLLVEHGAFLAKLEGPRERLLA